MHRHTGMQQEVNADYINIDGNCSANTMYGDTILNSNENNNQNARIPSKLGIFSNYTLKTGKTSMSLEIALNALF